MVQGNASHGICANAASYIIYIGPILGAFHVAEFLGTKCSINYCLACWAGTVGEAKRKESGPAALRSFSRSFRSCYFAARQRLSGRNDMLHKRGSA
jgi:hypothetical protein